MMWDFENPRGLNCRGDPGIRAHPDKVIEESQQQEHPRTLQNNGDKSEGKWVDSLGGIGEPIMKGRDKQENDEPQTEQQNDPQR